MHLFLAALYTNAYCPTQQRYEKLNEVERAITPAVPNVLESYHYVGRQRFVDTMREQGAQIFLDSGAFSAHTLGVQMDINAYCEYIKRNEDILRKEDGVVMASVLDGIGDPLQTYRNQLYMESQNAKPLPCFHYGEDIRYLEYYVANYNYITIGGLVRKSKADQQVWLDRIWPYMLDGSGRAKLKVHGFGMTSPSLMARYPWYSCDSSSWIQSASFGSIYTSEHGPIAVSKDSPSKHEAGRHLTTFTDIERQAIESMLERKGFNLERLSSVYESRAVYNCMSYQELNDWVNKQTEQGSTLEFNKVQELF